MDYKEYTLPRYNLFVCISSKLVQNFNKFVLWSCIGMDQEHTFSEMYKTIKLK